MFVIHRLNTFNASKTPLAYKLLATEAWLLPCWWIMVSAAPHCSRGCCSGKGSPDSLQHLPASNTKWRGSTGLNSAQTALTRTYFIAKKTLLGKGVINAKILLIHHIFHRYLWEHLTRLPSSVHLTQVLTRPDRGQQHCCVTGPQAQLC